MTDKTMKAVQGYFAPLVKVVRVSTGTRILAGSLEGNPGINDYEGGSSSEFHFGGDD